MDANKDLIAPAYCYDDIIKNETNGLMNGLLTLEEGAVIDNDLAKLDVSRAQFLKNHAQLFRRNAARDLISRQYFPDLPEACIVFSLLSGCFLF